MKDPYPEATRAGITIDNFREQWPAWRTGHTILSLSIRGNNPIAREKFYQGTNMIILGLDEKAEKLYFHPNEGTVERIRTWPEQTRLRSAAAQLLVNEFPNAWRDMVDSYGVKINQLVGVKKTPHAVGIGCSWWDHEGADCCKKFFKRIDGNLKRKGWPHDKVMNIPDYADEVDDMKKLMRHCRTRTHVMNKWNVSRTKLLREYNRLTSILRLEGYNLVERKEEYEELPF